MVEVLLKFLGWNQFREQGLKISEGCLVGKQEQKEVFMNLCEVKRIRITT